MSKFDDKTLSVAGVYSTALLQLAEARGVAEPVLGELEELSELAERDAAFSDFLVNPLTDTARRAESLETMFRGKASDLLVDALQVLNRKERIGLLPAIAETYRTELYELRDKVQVEVVSAIALTEAQRQSLAGALAEQTGRQPVLSERVDPSLIAGMVVQVGDRKVDTSVATKLKSLSEALLGRASRQVQSGAHL